MRVIAWILPGLVAILLAIVIYALARSKVEPIVWLPGPNPGLTGEFAPNGSHNMIVGVDMNGVVKYNLQSAAGPMITTTSATRVDGKLYIGNLGTDAVGVIDLP